MTVPLKAWAVITNHRFLRLENIKPTRIAASEHMRYLDRTYPHCVGTRRVARIEVREIKEERKCPSKSTTSPHANNGSPYVEKI